MFDTHTHPQMRQYYADREQVIKRALDAGIVMICVGVDLESSLQAIELAHKYESVWASVGLHPNDIDRYPESSIKNHDLKEYEIVAKDSRVIAIGEVGLDYYRTSEKDKQQLQREYLDQFIDLAIKYDKPLIIHCRDAHADLFKILNTKYLIHNTKLRGVIHSFTGTWQDAQRYLELGFYLGFNGIITFARQYDETVINTPLDRILLETDAPYLTPEPHRGQRNEPSYLSFIAQKIADLKNITTKEVTEKTTKNAKLLFNLALL